MKSILVDVGGTFHTRPLHKGATMTAPIAPGLIYENLDGYGYFRAFLKGRDNYKIQKSR
ncbi:hypothetical protein GCM10008019_42280 [Deinococcus soli (ex Cha et al. 2016)]|nr:hypothetical protein GCM10008019_42280 [Deinococcus soli (ex Cha et al. 2016)]